MSKQQDETTFWISIIIVALMLMAVLLPACGVMLMVLAVWRFFRIKWYYIAIAALMSILTLAFFDIKQLLHTYLMALKTAYLNHFSFKATPWLQLLPLAVVGGLTGAALIAAVIEIRGGGHKRQNDEKPGLVATWHRKRMLDKIATAEHPDYGVLLGINKETGRPVVLSDAELNQHCFLVGTTGSGKTTTIMNVVESALGRSIPLVLVDGKGASDLAERVKFLADRCGRKFYLFTMRGQSRHYNPLARGGITERKDKLISLTEWTEEHFKKMSERYLQLVFRCFAAAGEEVDLVQVARYLDPDNLVLLARGISDAEERNRILDALESFNVPEIRGLAARIAVMTESEIGHLFRNDESDKSIDLGRAIEENAVVVFLLDSLSFPEYSRLLGRLVVTDLKSVAARQFSDGRKKIYAIFDEFNVFASSAVVDLISKTRTFGFHVLIGTQSLSDLERAGGAALLEQVVENCNSFIIQRQNSAVNAEKLASIIGTHKSYEVTHQVQGILRIKTGVGSMRETRKFLVHPDEVKRLDVGEAILVRKAGGFGVEKIKVRRNGAPASYL